MESEIHSANKHIFVHMFAMMPNELARLFAASWCTTMGLCGSLKCAFPHDAKIKIYLMISVSNSGRVEGERERGGEDVNTHRGRAASQMANHHRSI